jgi:hypothetical protein
MCSKAQREMGTTSQLHVPVYLPPVKSPLFPLPRRLLGVTASMDSSERKEICCPCREQ